MAHPSKAPKTLFPCACSERIQAAYILEGVSTGTLQQTAPLVGAGWLPRRLLVVRRLACLPACLPACQSACNYGRVVMAPWASSGCVPVPVEGGDFPRREVVRGARKGRCSELNESLDNRIKALSDPPLSEPLLMVPV